MSDEELSIEETNKLRIQLGLKPIPAPNAEKEQVANANDSILLSETNKLRISLGLKPILTEESNITDHQTTEQYQSNIARAEKEERIKRNLEIAKSKASKKRKINVSKSLLDDNETEGVDDWLSKISSTSVPKKRKNSRKILEDIDSSTGLRVNHDIEELTSMNTDTVLTLKEQSIFDEDDQLESNILVDKKKLQNELSEKIRSNNYNKDGDERNVLDKYNEQLGELGTAGHFVISGSTIKVNPVPSIDEDPVQDKGKRIRFTLDLDDEEDNEDHEKRSDYAKAKPIKMKKIKGKKPKQTRKRGVEVDEDGDIFLQKVEVRDEDSQIHDDNELQSILSLTRLKNNKNKRKSPEELAIQIKQGEENQMNLDEVDDGITIDENKEFLNSIKNHEDDTELKESKLQEPFFKPEQDDNMQMDDAQREGSGVDSDEEDNKQPNFSGGLGSALSFLKSKSIVAERSKEEVQNEKIKKDLKQKQELAKIRLGIERRIREDELLNDPEFLKLSKKDKEQILERELGYFKNIDQPDDMTDKLQNYNPDIKIKYIGEDGTEMNQKEAFKQLSHNFHGNKNKHAKPRKTQERESLL